MQSRSNGVRTAAANLTSLERERRSKSAAPGRRAPARGEERSSRPPPPSVPSFGRLAQKGEGGCRCEARERGDWPARAEHHHPVRLASSPAGQRSGCRSRTRGFWTAVASEFLCLRPLGRRCGSERCAVAATAFRALSISVWALGDSERSAFDVGHGQGMLEAGTGLLLSPCCASAATFRSECGEGAFCLGRRRAAGDRLGMRRRRTMPQAGQQYYLLFGS
eukprot:tig00021326_g20272.t1